jgi:type VI secretion system protein ImpA
VLDIDALLTPVSEAEPAGQNTEYTGLAELERLAAGHPGTLDAATQEYVGAEEADWRKVHAAALELSRQTRDLRVAILLTRSELALDGLAGLGRGLVLVQRLLQGFWDTLYPRLDADEDEDAIERLNALANLADPQGIIRMLRRTPVVASRQVGRFTVRDLDLATGRLAPPEGVEAPGLALIEAAWTSASAEDNAARQHGVEQGYAALLGIEQFMREHAGVAPNMDALKQALGRLREFYAARRAQAEPPPLPHDLEPAPGPPGAEPPPGAAGPRGSVLASRDDAVRMLRQVSEFLRRTEPSSPAPLFIDRAVRVMQMSFADIVRDLMPDSKERIELLGGISLDPPAADEGGT